MSIPDHWLKPSPPLPVDDACPEISPDGAPSGHAPRFLLILTEIPDEEFGPAGGVGELERRNRDGGFG